MKILIDMNLSPKWVETLRAEGYEAVHWSTIGEPDAPDQKIFNWAFEQGWIVFTNDLDFGAILASTGNLKPSVIQVRTQNVTPNALADTLKLALMKFEEILREGALITIDEEKIRARILPMAGRFKTGYE
jgi:predicted nuclease of predicted toxin-antitoxin system